jgi:uncharacterized membrane protein YeiH
MSTILTVLEIIGVFSFSISGALMAIDKENDFFGVLFLAVITSFGGGMIRDIFIGNTPPVFFTLYHLIIVSVITASVVFVLAAIFKRKYVDNEKFVETVNNYFDALGLGVFVISGAKLCIDAGFTNPFLIIIMGMLSGTGGSITRDVIMREIPALLQRHIYLMAAIFGALLYYIFWRTGISDVIAVPISAVSIVIIRILATAFKWNMPKAIDFSKMSGGNGDAPKK